MPPGIKDVARCAGVSHATVSRVLANKPHVHEEVQQCVSCGGELRMSAREG